MKPTITLTAKDLMARWGVSKSTLYRLMASPNFPRSLKGPRRRPMVWLIADIVRLEKDQEWIVTRITGTKMEHYGPVKRRR